MSGRDMHGKVQAPPKLFSTATYNAPWTSENAPHTDVPDLEKRDIDDLATEDQRMAERANAKDALQACKDMLIPLLMPLHNRAASGASQSTLYGYGINFPNTLPLTEAGDIIANMQQVFRAEHPEHRPPMFDVLYAGHVSNGILQPAPPVKHCGETPCVASMMAIYPPGTSPEQALRYDSWLNRYLKEYPGLDRNIAHRMAFNVEGKEVECALDRY